MINSTQQFMIKKDIQKQCQTFKTLEWLKDLNQGLCGELFMVLGGNLDADLQVLPDVGL